jgi:hypothetical protein
VFPLARSTTFPVGLPSLSVLCVVYVAVVAVCSQPMTLRATDTPMATAPPTSPPPNAAESATISASMVGVSVAVSETP